MGLVCQLQTDPLISQMIQWTETWGQSEGLSWDGKIIWSIFKIIFYINNFGGWLSLRKEETALPSLTLLDFSEDDWFMQSIILSIYIVLPNFKVLYKYFSHQTSGLLLSGRDEAIWCLSYSCGWSFKPLFSCLRLTGTENPSERRRKTEDLTKNTVQLFQADPLKTLLIILRRSFYNVYGLFYQGNWVSSAYCKDSTLVWRSLAIALLQKERKKKK